VDDTDQLVDVVCRDKNQQDNLPRLVSYGLFEYVVRLETELSCLNCSVYQGIHEEFALRSGIHF
jgi:hypothetical protein